MVRQKKYKIELGNTNKELLKLEGYLDDKEARISLAKFLNANLGFTTELISGIKLAPFQEITLKRIDDAKLLHVRLGSWLW